jgi:hypothetical protein
MLAELEVGAVAVVVVPAALAHQAHHQQTVTAATVGTELLVQ